MDIGSALSSINAGIGLARTALDARDDRKAKEAVSEIAHQMADVNLWALGMSEHLRKLEAELRDTAAKLAAAEERERQRGKYVLRPLVPGKFVLAFEPVDGDQAPAHYLCQVCFDAGHTSVLQRSNDGVTFNCLRDRGHRLIVPKALHGLLGEAADASAEERR